MRAVLQSILQQLPSPTPDARLAQARAASLEALLAEARPARAAISTRMRQDRAAGQAALAALAERLVAAHRQAVLEQAPGRAARLDARLTAWRLPPLETASHPAHRQALRAAGRLDRLAGAVERQGDRLAAVLAETTGPLRVLDLHGGHGDLVAGLARWAQTQGRPLEATVADDRPGVVDHLCARLVAEGAAPRTAQVALDAPVLERRAHDVILLSHTSQRLSPGEQAVLLWEATQAARRAVLWIEGWRDPGRLLLGSLLAARPGGAQVVLGGGGLTPEEVQLVAAVCLGQPEVVVTPPGLIGALWRR